MVSMKTMTVYRTKTESKIENNSKLKKTRYFKRSILPSRIIVFETSTFSVLKISVFNNFHEIS